MLDNNEQEIAVPMFRLACQILPNGEATYSVWNESRDEVESWVKALNVRYPEISNWMEGELGNIFLCSVRHEKGIMILCCENDHELLSLSFVHKSMANQHKNLLVGCVDEFASNAHKLLSIARMHKKIIQIKGSDLFHENIISHLQKSEWPKIKHTKHKDQARFKQFVRKSIAR